ncbi:MAG: hypothetical protein NC548_41200 [Lachnospiraceae bacterium]|nr:hypothetical protein [Lachnospiraceae bacterium]
MERTVIHVEFDGKHYYFGSLASIYDVLTPQQLGITYGSLRNYGLSEEKPYKNSHCIIRKGILITKSGNRGRKPTTSTDDSEYK